MTEDILSLPSEAPFNTPKRRLFWYAYGLVAITSPLLVVVGACSHVVWLPDVMPPHEWARIGSAALPNGREVHVFQKWDSDFYVTAIVTREKGTPALVYVVDGDDTKQWWADLQVDPSTEQIAIKLSRGREFVYLGTSGALSEAGNPMEGDPIKQYQGASWPPFPDR